MDTAITLTADNWQLAVFGAIESLPEDVQASVGHSTRGEREVAITVAGDSFCVGEEACLHRVRARHFADGPEWLAACRAEEQSRRRGRPGKARAAEEDRLRRELESFWASQPFWDAPRICLECSGREESYNLGRADLLFFRCAVQVGILEAMFDGGLVGRVRGDRFVRLTDGSPILEWQFRPRRRRRR